MIEEPIKPVTAESTTDGDSLVAIRELRAALASDFLSAEEFCQSWREAAERFQTRSNLVGLKLLLLLLSRAPARETSFGELLFQQYSGIVLLIEGEMDNSRYHFQRQIELAQTLTDSDEIVVALLNMGRAHLNLFQLDKVRETTEAAEEILLADPNPMLQVKLLNRQVELTAYEHLTAYSIEKARMALQLAREQLMSLEEAFALHWLGVNWIYERKMEQAEKALLEALQIRQQMRDVVGRAETLSVLSRLYLKNGDVRMAYSYIEGAIAIMRQLKNQPGVAQTLYGLANLYYRTGDYNAALTPAMEAVEIRLELGEPTRLAEAFSLMGQIYQKLELFSMALTCHLRVLELYQSENKSPHWIDQLATTGDFLLHVDELQVDSMVYWKQGLESYRAALGIIEQHEDLYYLAPLLGRMARALLKLEGLEGVQEATRCYRLALALLGDIDSPHLPFEQAIGLRAEALNGLQICASLLRRTHSEN